MTLKRRLIPLLGGGLVGQALQISAVPLLTRLYGPERYGEYGLFAASLLFSGMLATLRYELAVQLPKKDSVANCVAVLSMAISIAVAVITFILALFVFTELVVIDRPWSFAIVLSLSTFLLAAFNILNALALRSGNYRINGLSRVVQIASGIFFALLFYFFEFSSQGLLYANALGYLMGVVVLMVSIFSEKWVLLYQYSRLFHAMKIVARRYSGFALFNAPQALMDGMRPMFVVSMIQQHYGVADVGRYHIANQLLQTPVSLISQAFSQVYFRSLVEKCGSADMFAALKQILGILCLLALTGFVFVYVFSDPLVGFLFGSKWNGLGLMLKILAVLAAVNLIVGPLIYIFHARRLHREFFVWGAIYNSVAVCGIWFGSSLFSEACDALLAYSLSGGGVLIVIGLRSIWLTLKISIEA